MKIDKNQFEKDAVAEFDDKFSNSEFWLENYPKNYKEIKKFVIKIVKETEEKTKVYCLEQYDDFYKELKKEDKI